MLRRGEDDPGRTAAAAALHAAVGTRLATVSPKRRVAAADLAAKAFGRALRAMAPNDMAAVQAVRLGMGLATNPRATLQHAVTAGIKEALRAPELER